MGTASTCYVAMAIILAHMSALDFWRKRYPLWKSPTDALEFVADLRPAIRAEDVWALAPSWVTPQFLAPEDGVLHVLAFESDARRSSKSHQVHAWSAPLPPHSLYRLGPEAYVASPAFAFLQMASVLELSQLIALGCELCGLYSFDESQERGIRNRRVPLITKANLIRYLVDANDAPGAKKALRAMRYVVDRSASPMETVCALALSLPYRYGGYGIPAPEMNFEVPLDERARKIYGNERCFADLAWPASGFALEYLGLYDHSGDSAVRRDRARTIALETMGYTVVELVTDIVWNLGAFEQVALRTAKVLGKRVEHKYQGSLPARVELRRMLSDWNDASGRVSSRLGKKES